MFKWLVFFGMMASVCRADDAAVAAEKLVSNGNNLLGFKIYKELAKSSGNILFSPASAETILALTYTGAKGPTADEMATTLSLPKPEQTAAGFKELTRRLQKSQNGVIYNSANKLYTAPGIKIKDDFLTTAQTAFDSDVENTDFNDNVGSANKINQWVESKTNNKIKDLIKPDSLTSMTRLVLVNAVYFNGIWKNPFTVIPSKLEFHTSETESVETEFMSLEAQVGYAEIDNAQIVDIPYNDTDYSLRIILPSKINGLAEIESQLPFDLEAQTKKLHQLNVNIRMPKFKIEQTIQMVDHLKNIGMKTAFSDGADFSGISSEPLFISDVIQKAFIEVNEKGTEAAAATAEEIELRIGRGNYKIDFTADKPFLFMLIENTTNFVAFIGRISKLK